MDFLTILLGYGIVALGIALTSYITIYRPSIHILEEIVEQNTVYSGVIGFLLWTVFGALTAPWVTLVLLSNNNEDFITDFAASLAEKYFDEDE